MKPTYASVKSAKRGFALITALVLSGITLLLLLSSLDSVSSNTRQTMSSAQYFASASAAEAATEKVLSRMLKDFQNSGEATVFANLTAYSTLVPDPAESPLWDDYRFDDGSGDSDRTFVARLSAGQYADLNSEYAGLKGWVSNYRIISNARQKTSRFAATAAVAQDIQTASIPIFQFAIFYNIDLELHSLTTMDIIGRVHSNRNLYTYPAADTTFWSDVTTGGNIIKTRKPGDPAYSTAPAAGKTIFKAKADTKVSSLNLPIGTNNTPEAVRQILYPPPAGEPLDSPLARQRYYHKAELVIQVNNASVIAFAKPPFGGLLDQRPIPWTNLTAIVRTNVSFTDDRESKVIKGIEIDVSKLSSWSLTNVSVTNAIGKNPVNLIYVQDQRTLPATQLGAVRLVNGAILPSRGLTVATPNPIYVKGNFNQPTAAYLGTTNTTTTFPASLVSDALTILSASFADGQTGGSYTYKDRKAVNTTVNAAVISGIVETSPTLKIYSGGAHNLGRFIEDWTGRTFTYNGSMVVLFPSNKATAPFQQPGAYYYPPARDYAFDLNFRDGTKLPPGTPDLRVLLRGRWALVQPNKTDFGTALF